MMELTDLTRRDLIEYAAATTLLAGLGNLARADAKQAGSQAAPGWMVLLGQSEQGERNAEPSRIEGTIPIGLRGSLYRNGPGLFERGGQRKRHLLDGDGLVQRLSFADGKVRYQNSFVKTPKFLAEQAEDRYLYSTWSTRRPGGALRNLGGGPMSVQAGVTVYPVNDKLYALDEGNPIFELDPESLATIGSRNIGQGSPNIKAHTRFDPMSGEWLLVGQDFGRRSTLYAIVYDRNGKLVRQHRIENVPMVYFHDFLITENYFVYILHPCEMEPFGFLLGLRSVIDSLRWRPAKGNQVVLQPRAGGKPLYFEAPSSFMWHGLNAYEHGDEIIAEFVGYDHPDHFIGQTLPVLSSLMKGDMGAAEEPGKIRRYTMNTQSGKLREEILDQANHEFPMIDPKLVSRQHRIGYFSFSGIGVLQSGIKRLDMASGAQQTFDFGPETHVGEPVFAAKPGSAPDEGWLLVQGLDGKSKHSFFAIFDAQSLSQGPVAKIWLDHHLPISFHGWWKEQV